MGPFLSCNQPKKKGANLRQNKNIERRIQILNSLRVEIRDCNVGVSEEEDHSDVTEGNESCGVKCHHDLNCYNL